MKSVNNFSKYGFRKINLQSFFDVSRLKARISRNIWYFHKQTDYAITNNPITLKPATIHPQNIT